MVNPVRLTLLVMALAGFSSQAFGQAGDAAAGEQLYEENCSICHGERLRATGAGPDLKLLGADQKDKFEKTVQEGRGQMPSWGGVLTDDDRDAIWAYIRSRAR